MRDLYSSIIKSFLLSLIVLALLKFIFGEVYLFMFFITFFITQIYFLVEYLGREEK